MTPRERYINTLLFKPTDKVPFSPGGPRKSTLERWCKEGLPEGADWFEYVCSEIGITPERGSCPKYSVDFLMRPWFEEKIFEHKNGHYIIQDWKGNIVEISDKFDAVYLRQAIDFVTRRWIKCPVENRDDWEQMKERYNPFDETRVPAVTAEERDAINARTSPLSLSISGPFWQLREWMGFENLCMAFIESPEFVAEMIEFWQNYVLDILERVRKSGVTIDRLAISEDMAYKAHSMISPAMTREFLMPVYKKWVAKCREMNIPIIDMDSDGYVADLIPIWIESGINVCDPMEVAAHNDIVAYRNTFGKQIAYTGGVDKRAMAQGGKVIEDELKRILPPLLKDGGYIPGCDHGVPHDISLPDFIYYSKLLAKYTGWL